MMKRYNRRLITLFIAICLFVLFPATVFASDGVPWYAKPIEWFFDIFLGLLGGVHDPMDHVFYQSCGPESLFSSCEEKTVWGLYTQVQYDSVVVRGFYILGIIGYAIIFTSIIKAGILLSTKAISSTAKFEVSDMVIKSIIASILLGNIFSIVGGLFSLNNAVVNHFEKDLRGQLTVTRFDGTIIPRNEEQAVLSADERIEMTDLTKGHGGNFIEKTIIVLIGKGVGIWWEVFYLQRKFMISLLLILAPIWICCLFSPYLVSVTFTALKELWSQIIAQALHAIMFWAYFNLMDSQMGWLQTVVIMSLFIPLSESLRFILGATSNSGSKLAFIGTLAGAGALMNMGKGLATIAGGGKNALSALRGMDPSGNTTNSGGQGSSASNPQGSSVPQSRFSRGMRATAHLAAGFGAAIGRNTMGLAAGASMGPGGMYFGGEIGERAGSRVGYGAGAMGSLASRFAYEKAIKEPAGRFKQGYSGSESRSSVGKTMSGLKNVFSGSRQAPLSYEEIRTKEANRRERSGQRFGTFYEAMSGPGKGGYEAGYTFGARRRAGRQLTQERLNNLRENGTEFVYTVETEHQSSLAVYDQQNKSFKPISNISGGNPAAAGGKTIVSKYSIEGSGKQVRLVPVKEQIVTKVEGKSPKIEFVNHAYMYDSSGQTAYTGKTVDPHKFIGSENKTKRIDLMRDQFKPNMKS